jgi:hypothetical protein
MREEERKRNPCAVRVSRRLIMTVMSHGAESSNEMMTLQNISRYFD